MIHSILPFHFTLPMKAQPKSCIQFYTSDKPVHEDNIEAYYALLLLQEPSFYLRAEKAPVDSLLSRFLELASPFLTFESMSVLLDVPLEKVFSLALSLQASNTAVIMMSITKYTHFVNALDLHQSRIAFESRSFETRFSEFGSLMNLLAVFSNAPSLEAVFSHFHLSFAPAAVDASPVFKMMVALAASSHV